MKKIKIILPTAFAVALAFGLFQNCSGAKHSTTASNASSSINPNTSEAVSCFKIQCTSLAGLTQTVSTPVMGDGIYTAPAPSGGGAWVFSITNGQVESINCWSDQATVNNNYIGYSIVGNALCEQYAAGTQGLTPGYDTFTQGYGNSFASCQQVACD